MSRFCTSCGAQMSDTSAFCPNCGKSVVEGGAEGATPPPVTTATGGAGLTDNMAGLLAYVTIIPAIIFLVVAPYNRNRFVRFHAFQCIFCAIALIVIHIVLTWLPMVGWALSSLVNIAAFVLWIVLMVKAYGGQMFKVPVIGDMAEKQANAV